MDKWNLVSPDQVMSLFKLPANLAHSPDYHFYVPLDFKMHNTDDIDFRVPTLLDEQVRIYYHNRPRFQFLGLIRSAPKYDFVSFRFWSLHEDWMSSDVNILLPAWSGYIDVYISEIDDLITLLKRYGRTLQKTSIKKPMFQLIPRQDYEKFQIDTSYTSQRVKIYLCNSDAEPYVDDHFQDAHKLLAITHEWQKMALRTTFVPRTTDPGFQFQNRWVHGQGWLNLTRQGIEEFCELVEAK